VQALIDVSTFNALKPAPVPALVFSLCNAANFSLAFQLAEAISPRFAFLRPRNYWPAFKLVGAGGIGSRSSITLQAQ
jgi:hypothetical protein